jgi:hypothetical protein
MPFQRLERTLKYSQEDETENHLLNNSSIATNQNNRTNNGTLIQAENVENCSHLTDKRNEENVANVNVFTKKKEENIDEVMLVWEGKKISIQQLTRSTSNEEKDMLEYYQLVDFFNFHCKMYL